MRSMAREDHDHTVFGITAKVMLICDSPEIGKIWAHCLRQRHYETILFTSAERAVQNWSDEVPDLIVIDANAPSFDPIELCRDLRGETIAPILVFTPQNNETHILEAYQAGADECMAKPISPALFLAKVRVWLRRAWTMPTEALDQLKVGDLTLDPGRRVMMTPTGDPVRLTNLEFRLLHLLMNHPGRVLETDEIIQRVWGYNGEGNSTLLKNLVYRLRRKIEPDPAEPHYLLTETGIGYKFLAN